MFRYSLLLFSFFLFSSYSYSNALIPSSPVAISSEATQGASLFESLIGSSVTSSSLTGTTVGETLFGDLLSRPIVSAVITGATLIPQLSPQVRVGVALAGVLLNTPQSQLFLNPSKGGPVPLGWSGPNSPPITVTSSQQQNFSVSTVCGSYSGNSSSSACAAALGTIAGVPGECGNFTISSAGGNLCNWTYNPNGNHGVIGIPYSSSSPSCPLGYVLDSSSSCVLDENSSNGYASYPDTVPPALVATNTGSAWIFNPRNNPMDNYQTVIIPSSPTVTESGTDPITNQPYQLSVNPTSTGGLNISSSNQFTDSNGNTSVQNSTVVTDNNGVVTSTNSNVYPNINLTNYNQQLAAGTLTTNVPVISQPVGPAPAGTTLPAPNPNRLPITATVPNLVPFTQGTPKDLTPVQTPVPEISPGTVPVPQQHSPSQSSTSAGSCDCPINLTVPTAPTFQDTLQNIWNGINASPLISAFRLSFSDSSCPPLTVDFSSLSGVWSLLGYHSTTVHCQLLESIRNVLGYVCLAVASVVGMFIILSA